MIARYSRPEMTEIWNDRRRYQVWLEVELAVCAELAREGIISRTDWKLLEKKARALLKKGGVDPKRVEAHEKVTRHDIIAFTTAVADEIGPISRYVHFGLTSSDVVDTALSLTIQEAGVQLQSEIETLLDTLKSKAIRYKKLATIGRSHGIFAEPTSFGLKFLGWYSEWKRNLERLDRALEGLRVGKLSGAVGVNAHWSPGFEEKVLKSLGLKREPVSTQVIPRDRHAEFFCVIAQCGSSIERMCVELRHLQRSEVNEVMEGFSRGQKGSSAMPHKRNPISAENLSGCARLLRSYALAALENVPLWHERDISHSSVERVAFPDAAILLDYALDRMNGVLSDLVVREEQVRANLAKAGSTVFSGHYLLALVRAGATREHAYAWIQQCALQSLEGRGEFTELLSKNSNVARLLGSKKIQQLASSDYQLRHVEEIFKKVLQSSS